MPLLEEDENVEEAEIVLPPNPPLLPAKTAPQRKLLAKPSKGFASGFPRFLFVRFCFSSLPDQEPKRASEGDEQAAQSQQPIKTMTKPPLDPQEASFQRQMRALEGYQLHVSRAKADDASSSLKLQASAVDASSLAENSTRLHPPILEEDEQSSPPTTTTHNSHKDLFSRHEAEVFPLLLGVLLFCWTNFCWEYFSDSGLLQTPPTESRRSKSSTCGTRKQSDGTTGSSSCSSSSDGWKGPAVLTSTPLHASKPPAVQSLKSSALRLMAAAYASSADEGAATASSVALAARPELNLSHIEVVEESPPLFSFGAAFSPAGSRMLGFVNSRRPRRNIPSTLAPTLTPLHQRSGRHDSSGQSPGFLLPSPLTKARLSLHDRSRGSAPMSLASPALVKLRALPPQTPADQDGSPFSCPQSTPMSAVPGSSTLESERAETEEEDEPEVEVEEEDDAATMATALDGLSLGGDGTRLLSRLDVSGGGRPYYLEELDEESPLDQVLAVCEQKDLGVLAWADLFPPGVLEASTKIGEGSYGEVFKVPNPAHPDPTVIKVAFLSRAIECTASSVFDALASRARSEARGMRRAV